MRQLVSKEIFRYLIGLSAILTVAPVAAQSLSGTDTVRIQISYIQPAWNLHPWHRDSGSLLLLDTEKTQMSVVKLTETAPSSSIFVGQVPLIWSQIAGTRMQVYTLSHSQIGKNLQTLLVAIKNHQIKRKPYILRRTAENEENLEVFANRGYAANVFSIYQAMGQIRSRSGHSPQQRQELQRFLQNAKSVLKKQKQFMAVPLSEQKYRMQIASDLAKKAMAAYKKGDYKTANRLFQQAMNDDPITPKYRYRYAVCQFKLGHANESLSNLMLVADSKGIDNIERSYFLGLDLLKLNQLNGASQSFQVVRQADNKFISPSASYYEGIIGFRESHYRQAKTAFQYTIHTSSDDDLNQSADQYLKQIALMEAFLKEKEKKFIISESIGTAYDSNVTLISNGSASATNPSKMQGIRFAVAAGLEWRSDYQLDHMWATKLNYSTVYTTTNSLRYNSTLDTADPTLYQLYEAYRYKGMLWSKHYRLEISPGFEIATMAEQTSAAESTRNTSILNSYVLNLNNAFIMNDNWYLAPNFQIRYDDSTLADSIGINNSSALKGTLALSNVYLLNRSKTKSVFGSIGVSLNDAAGTEYYYSRYDLSLGYMAPLFGKYSWNTQIAYYLLDYPQAILPRTENDISYSAGLSRPLKKWLSAVGGVTYTQNISNDPTHAYNKWVVMISLVGAESF